MTLFPRQAVHGLLAAGTAFVMLHPAAVRAQAALPPIGTRVRIAVADSLRREPFGPRSALLVGTLVRSTSDSLYLALGTIGATAAVPRGAVRDVAVSRGASRAASAVEQALSVGFGLGITAYAAQHGSSDDQRRALGFAVGGAALGAVVGAVRPYERWRRVRE